MNKYLLNNKKSNYDKFPVVQVPGEEHSCVTGWENVTAELRSLLQQKKILVVECYQGVHDDEVLKALYEGFPEACILESVAAMKGQDAYSSYYV